MFNQSNDTAFFYHQMGNKIGTILFSLIYFLGFIGNTLSILTFSSRRMRQISSSIFLLALSISDTIALITSIWYFLADAFNIRLQNYSALACRFRLFCAYLFMDLSSWCIAALAVDRYLRTKLPLASRTICTPRNTCKVIFVFVILLSIINGHYFSPAIGQEQSENRSTAHCLENQEDYPNYFYFHKIIWPKIDMMVFCFLPACIMILCNINIIYLVKRQRYSLESNVDLSFENDLSLYRTSSRSFTEHRKALERQMSLMMIACVIVFILTSVPVTIYLIFLENVVSENPDFPRDNAFCVLIFRVLRAWMYLHFSLNFYLQCLTSRIFRAEFLRTITCQSSKPEPIPLHPRCLIISKCSDH